MLTPALASQKTLKAPIHCTGIGLHSGVKAALTLRPAPVGTGILFRRLDGVGGPVEIAAHWSNALESPLCTTLTDGKNTSILTIEHLMSALAGCGIDNCTIEIIGPEVPIMDGSSAPFVFLIECAGTIDQHVPRQAIKVLKPVSVGDDRAWTSIEPDDQFSVEFEIDFPSKAIARQTANMVIDPVSFKHEISRARTFGFLKDLDALRANGRALGGSLDNAVVIDGDTVVNSGGLRYADEFVRHKVLDAVGDLYLAGGPLLGRFRGSRSSHALNRRLLAALFADRDAWSMAAVDEAPFGRWQEPRALSA
ncbi:MAG: UDP-3-O-[3-hydroxymyristoyl] N-acetylglucosamine deacetylase [Aliidongia sp.]|jgi:UDP-3-O-[3-hydroxymyristoyl] N-acetylglucosamine deacetylase|nr:UDP-3-O-[3-hydroxymyristoyl] N-acetylglucosamine deacetylase [Aliidongia sp.]